MPTTILICYKQRFIRQPEMQRKAMNRSRSSRDVAVAILVAILMSAPVSESLTPSSLPSGLRTGWTAPRIQSPSTVLQMVESSSLPRVEPTTKRLSLEEERGLLRQAHELTRLKNLEQDLAMKSPDLQTPLLSVRSKAAGYGEDLEAYEDAIDDGHKARETLVTSNMGLVHFCVNDIVGKKRAGLKSLSREDLIQEGSIGLARAVDKFNLSLGTRFSTYAVYWIRAAIFRGIAERDDLVRVPEHMSSAVRKVTAAAKRLGLELDGDRILSTFATSGDSWKEARAAKALAEEAGVTEKQLQQALRVKQQRKQVSFEAWMQKGKSFETDLSAGDDEEISPTKSLDTEHLKTTLSKFLRPREMEALSWRYGLKYRDYLGEAEEELFGSTTKGKWGEAMSFTEVGKHMSISAEYGRRLCHKALDKLKQAAADGQLEPALLF